MARTAEVAADSLAHDAGDDETESHDQDQTDDGVDAGNVHGQETIRAQERWHEADPRLEQFDHPADDPDRDHQGENDQEPGEEIAPQKVT